MPDTLHNPFRGAGLPGLGPFPRDNAMSAAALLAKCPAHAATPLLDLNGPAARCGVARLSIKDERGRMGLGSFKALGAAHAIAQDAANAGAGGNWARALAGRCYVAASAGNHGLSVAAGARLFGAQAVVFLAQTVSEAFAGRLRAKGARVMRAGATYEESMAAAEAEASRHGWTLLSDSSWPGYIEMPLRVMEGYLQLAAEAVKQIGQPPTHIVLQAGVGGLAAAVAAHIRAVWGEGPTIVVIEPAFAPALFESIRAGRLTTSQGPVSSMGRLDCKTPSMIALAGLARDADIFATISEEDAARGAALLQEHGIATTTSGAAGLAGLMAGLPGIGGDSRALAILSEGPDDA